MSLSLSGSAVMEFRLGDDHRALFLPRRSLLVMSGPARYQWAHYIPHRKRDVVDGELVARSSHRVSFTLRQVCAQCSQWAFQGMCRTAQELVTS